MAEAAVNKGEKPEMTEAAGNEGEKLEMAEAAVNKGEKLEMAEAAGNEGEKLEMAEAAVNEGEKLGKDIDKASLLSRYIECAEHLIQKCRQLGGIQGSGKLERKCAAEMKYLKSLTRRRGGYDVTHLRSSNLSNYAGVLHAVDNLPFVTNILQPFSCPGRTDPLHVDVVAYHGHVWVKIVARKAQALHLIWAGNGQYGEKDIVLQAEDFVTCSKIHPKNFVDPKVVFAFYNGVTTPLAEKLDNCGVIVLGERVPVESDVQQKLTSLCIDDSDTEDESFGSEDDIPTTFMEDIKLNTASFDMHNDNTHKLPVYTVATESSDPNSNSQCLNEHASNNSRITADKRDNDANIKSTDIYNLNENIDCDLQQKDNTIFFRKENSSIEMEEINKKASTNLREGPMTDLFSVNKYESYPIDQHVTQTPPKNDCTTLNSIDLHISGVHLQEQITNGQFGTADESRTKKTNLVVNNLDNMSGVLLCPKKQFQTKTELPNKSAKNTDCTFDKWNFGGPSVLSFIRRELLVNPILDFCVLGRKVTANEMNNIDKIRKVNLDITALITLVSAVSHGGCFFRFREKILSEQATEERTNPVLPKLLEFLKGKQWFACQTALDSFNNILDTLGGPQEKQRASTLLSELTIVKDEPSFRARMIPNTGKIKDRSKIIFGTGDSLRAITVTANSRFVRAAEHQGVSFAVFLHASRALTEQKEHTAEEITDTLKNMIMSSTILPSSPTKLMLMLNLC